MSEFLKNICIDQIAGNITKDQAYDLLVLHIEKLENDFFRQAFCAALGGLNANANLADRENKLLVRDAIQQSKESVRQVAELSDKCNHDDSVKALSAISEIIKRLDDDDLGSSDALKLIRRELRQGASA